MKRKLRSDDLLEDADDLRVTDAEWAEWRVPHRLVARLRERVAINVETNFSRTSATQSLPTTSITTVFELRNGRTCPPEGKAQRR